MRVETVNVESRLPSGEEGVARLKRDIASARQLGVRVLRVIHGWGSSGAGGRLRNAGRSFLYRGVTAMRVKGVLSDEDYSRAAVAGRDLTSRYEELGLSDWFDAQNSGITMVVL